MMFAKYVRLLYEEAIRLINLCIYIFQLVKVKTSIELMYLLFLITTYCICIKKKLQKYS
jgi:hypothetical protein